MDLAVDQTGPGNRWSLAAGIAGLGLRPVTDPARQRDLLASRRQGRIVTEQGRLLGVHGRWWPHYGNWLQVLWEMNFRTLRSDRCELYFHQPLTAPQFLTLAYVHSGPQTSLSTFYAATLMLDEIARLRGALAIVCHVTNSRLSHRLMERWGWQQHCMHWSGRHYIKRFYGTFPEIAIGWRRRLKLD